MTLAVRKILWPLLAAGCALSLSAVAQPLRLSASLNTDVGTVASQVDGRTVDYIVALVNSEPVTNNEVRQRLLRIEQQMTQQGTALPPRDELAQRVLELLVSERAQLQDAAELGLSVDDAALAQAEQALAAQNQLGLEAFRQRIVAQGMDLNRFRNELRSQLLLRKVRDRETERVRVNNAEIDRHIEELNARNPEGGETLLRHVLIKVPESVDAETAQSAQAKAQSVAARARSGEDFAALAREVSDAPEGATGGSFGWRTASQLPTLFVQSTKGLPVGGVSEPFRSPAGWHVLKVDDRRQSVAPELMVVKTRTSHILLRVGPQLSQEAAIARLADMREKVIKGQATFESLARQFSQDGSASQGGDLGWVAPGQFVPEFEAVMDRLSPGELSQPTVSRFGVHLIRLDNREQVAMTTEQQREAVRNVLRDQKAEEALQIWAQNVRARAYVEFRDPPRP
ncbi:molecular chaperone SurA [Hydrogenophaga crassostreae]|uniref:Chaperone SurA n=1 Tax=Hydrogenophaga crassostreae TaxID=1763535 RepID=A0A167GCY2_9BURK|nr:peptidylprolyl isomerase [Hydrogenophaga crassostreae]AOW15190.1 molecular chaperone SurA [Hydrogenophaga crassostreae]OAD39278.1 molecular chaperone SurA [Hydrogenophaga crassostreae]